VDSLSFVLGFGSLRVQQIVKGKFVSFSLSIVWLISWTVNVSFDSLSSLWILGMGSGLGAVACSRSEFGPRFGFGFSGVLSCFVSVLSSRLG